jgi:hypothetical protein
LVAISEPTGRYDTTTSVFVALRMPTMSSVLAVDLGTTSFR